MGTKGRIREGIACLHVVMPSFFFQFLIISICLHHIDGMNTPAAAVHPQPHMFWGTPQHFAEGRREAGFEGRAGNANSNPPDPLKSD